MRGGGGIATATVAVMKGLGCVWHFVPPPPNRSLSAACVRAFDAGGAKAGKMRLWKRNGGIHIKRFAAIGGSVVSQRLLAQQSGRVGWIVWRNFDPLAHGDFARRGGGGTRACSSSRGWGGMGGRGHGDTGQARVEMRGRPGGGGRQADGGVRGGKGWQGHRADHTDVIGASPLQLASLISNPPVALSPERAAQAFGRISRLWNQATDEQRGLLRQTLCTLQKQSEEVAGRMSSRHVCVAVACISKCGGVGGKDEWLSSSPPPAPSRLLETLQGRALQVIPMFKPQGVSNLLKALASMHQKPEAQLVGALLDKATATADSFNPHDISILFGALAALSRIPEPPLHYALSTSLEHQMQSANSQDIANVLWAHATLRLPLPSHLLSTLDHRATEVTPSFSPVDLSKTIWAFASLGCHPSEKLLNRLRWRSLDVASILKPREVANILWALATMHIPTGHQLASALSQRCLATLQQFNPQDVSNVLWALAKSRQPPPSLLVSGLVLRAQDTAGSFSPREVAMTLWGVATISTNLARSVWSTGGPADTDYSENERRSNHVQHGLDQAEVARTAAQVLGVRVQVDAVDTYPSQHDGAPLLWVLTRAQVAGLVGSLGGRVEECIDDFQPQELSNLLWACATLAEHPGESLLGTIKQRAVCTISDFKPQELSNLLSALATMGEPPGDELGGAVRNGALAMVDSFNPRDVSSTLWAFATLGESPGPELLSALCLRAVDQISSFDAQSTANTLWAFAALGKIPRGQVLAALCARAEVVFTREAEACRGEGGDPMGRMRQIHQFMLSCELEGLHEGALQEPSVLALREVLGQACRAAFSCSFTSESNLQRQVAMELRDLGLDCEEEAVDPASGYTIDVLVRMRDGQESIGLAVEVDGPAHFLAGPRARARGSTLLKRRQLRLLGYRVVSVPYWQWDSLGAEGSKAEYLRGLLGLGGVRGGGRETAVDSRRI